MGLYESLASSLPRAVPLKRSNDRVYWTAFSQQGTELNKWKPTTCFESISFYPENFEVHCYPYPRQLRTNRLGRVLFKQYIHNFIEVGLMPSTVKVKISRSKGNGLILPRTQKDYHSSYIPLVLYRVFDSYPGAMWIALKIQKETKLPWLQVFQYVVGNIGLVSNHFIFNASATYGSKDALNPGISMALCTFGHLTPQERSKLPSPRSTHGLFNKLAQLVNPAPRYLYSSLEEILNPKYSPLFVDPSLGQEELKQLMEDK